MSGVISSKRQWASLRVRALAATLLALAMLIPAIGVVMAQEPEPQAPEAGWQPYAGANRFCIVGNVINFDETPLPYSDKYTADTPSEPWQITAVQAGSEAAAQVATTDEDGNFEFKDLVTGTWTISITRPAGWEPVDPYTDSYDVTLGYGATDCARVRFKLRWPVDVSVYKIDDNHRPLSGWTIRAQPAYGNWFASPVEGVTDDTGLAQPTFRLTAGKWIFTERAPAGTHFVPVMPESGKQELVINPREDTKITLRFKNRILSNGCIVVTKEDVAPENDPLGSFGLPGWKMTVKRLDGSVAASGMTNARGEVRFDNLSYGPYVVVEEERAGWAATGAVAVQVVVAPTDEGCTEVGFANRQAPPGFCFEGYKIDANQHVGIPNWKITATPITKGAYPNPDVDRDANNAPLPDHLTAFTDGTGRYVFNSFPANDYRVPGAAYKVCEENRAGWLPHTATCQTVYLPKKPSACIRLRDFVNQQVGHSEAMAYGRHPNSGSSTGCAVTHTVVAGESLFGIGNAYGVSGGAMLSANPWVYNRHNRYVFPGDSVCIP